MIRLERAADGSLVAFLANNAQEKGAPFSLARLRGDSLVLQSDRMSAQFEGLVSVEQRVIEGAWSQGERSANLTLTPVEEAATDETASTTSTRPQHPERPYPYRTEEITFKSDAGGVTLAGTLSMPKEESKLEEESRPEKEGPHPAVVLLQGSGENGRDYAYQGHKFFLVLADHLTRQGIAVLRYDLRGVGESEGHLSGASLEDLARDAASALRFLKNRPGVDPTRVGLIGHSMGGMIAPRIHDQFEQAAFLALLAPPSLPGHQVLSRQRARIADASGASPADVDSIRKQSRQVFEIIRSDRDSADVASQLRPILQEGSARQEGSTRSDRLQLKVEANTSPWFRDFARHDPRPALRQVDVPILALFGGRDLLVPPQQNAGPMRAALADSLPDRVSVRVLEELNHRMQPVKTEQSSEVREIETTVAPKVLKQLTRWIREHAGLE
ncbi:alpha/beta hydrolase family protein [Salinibacter altiplanensis]|uniref:alpha/beta hydrolase family protein n=1 Tax=Salinibacter altiplanensis TaxID=1803181 RepID=UPI00131A58D5|nr:alpha/beta fold hydrolase [Salinibacter altiplanensis]